MTVKSKKRAPKIVVVMPAYNAGRTLRMTYEELPKDTVNLVILVDDGSTDMTLEVARQLGLEIFVHNRNYGYGANQKTCYTEALRAGADIVVMVHPDYQYDPRLVPQIVEPVVGGRADVVLGSRLKSGSALAQGMPWWKFLANRVLTVLENRAFGCLPGNPGQWNELAHEHPRSAHTEQPTSMFAFYSPSGQVLSDRSTDVILLPTHRFFAVRAAIQLCGLSG